MRLTSQEVTEHKLSQEHHAQAVRDLQVSGYTILEGALPLDVVDKLHSAFIARLEENMQQIGPNRGKARQGGVALPIEPPFSDPEVLGNPLALDILADILDGDIVCSYFASDTPLPGSEYQPVHRDGKYLFPGLAVTLPPYMLELNIPLVDFREDNGPLEVWPRTHLLSNFEPTDAGSLLRPAEEERHTDVQQFAEQLQSQRVLMPAGSFLLRDPRMWHRGTPNRSDSARPMLSIAYNRPWYRFNAVRVARDVFEAWPAHLQRIFRLACIGGEHSQEFV